MIVTQLTLFFHKTLTSLRVGTIFNSYLLVVTIFLKNIEEMISRVFSRQRWSGVYCGQGNNLIQVLRSEV